MVSRQAPLETAFRTRGLVLNLDAGKSTCYRALDRWLSNVQGGVLLSLDLELEIGCLRLSAWHWAQWRPPQALLRGDFPPNKHA